MKTMLVTLILSGCLASLFPQCSTTSVLGGHIIYNDLTASPLMWANLPGAENSDNNRTISGQSVPTNGVVNTSDLWAQTFLFSVPSTAIICGVEVRIERRQVGAIAGSSSVIDKSVRLIHNMTVTGSEHATTLPWSSTDQEDIYGGTGDLWGLNLTPAIVNAPDFGVAISAKLQNTGAPVTMLAQVDKVSIMVYYTQPLPVELLSFEATADHRNVELEWKTASENNNAYFLVERSTDAIHWNTVTTIPGNGTTNTENEYHWTDQNAPDGVLYYNLKQVDQNGDPQHLGSTTVTLSPEKELDLVYNPSTSTVQLFGLNQAEQSSLTILDVSGKAIFSTQIQNDQTEIRLKDQPSPGIYFFHLSVDGKIVVKKMMVG
jgi:hypothetical protein